MSDEDNIFREVDEEIRREQVKAYWDKFGIYIISVAASIVLIVAGYQGWTYWHQSQTAQAGLEFVKAQDLAKDDKTDEAANAFKKLIESGPKGYSILARFQLASTQAADGKSAEAAKTFESIVKDNNADPVIKGYAKLQSALLRVDEAKFEDIKNLLVDINTPKSHWRHSARELLGLSAYKNGQYDVAKTHYNSIITDAQASETLKERASMMLTLILARTESKTATK
ncbi:MAG: tetratricopeptide repeat protein [Pseudomonadota bacterium]